MKHNDKAGAFVRLNGFGHVQHPVSPVAQSEPSCSDWSPANNRGREWVSAQDTLCMPNLFSHGSAQREMV
jgi:hypothetical protein